MALAIIPGSKISSSGLMPRLVNSPAKVSIRLGGFQNTSSPKLTVPIVSEAISGVGSSSRTGLSRSSTVAVTAPPVEIWMMQSTSALMRRIVSAKRAGSWLGVPSSSRT
ncbi:hypothetical protein D3C87_1670770 [compost metagenome]